MSLKNHSVTALFLTLNLAAAVAWAGPITLSLTPSSSTVQVGDHFDVVVAVAGAQAAPYTGDEVLGFGFDVDLGAASLVAWTAATVAIPPFADDLSALLLNTDVAGSVGFGAGLPDDAFTLAVLSFTALAEGTLDLGIASDLLDLNEGLIYLLGDPLDLRASIPVTISAAEGAAPLPATLALLLVGLPWLWRRDYR